MSAVATWLTPRDGLGGALRRRLGLGIALTLYALVVLFGASYSSLGIGSLREDPAQALESTWGEPQPIRSDEYLTQTPIELSVLSLGHSYHSPLSESGDVVFQLSSGQPVESVFFFETTLLRLGPWLPDANLFAAWRALPFLLLALTLPPLLRRMGATRPMSWLAYFLVVLAPTSLWWSFTPVRILAAASLGSLLLVIARERWTAGASRRRTVSCLGVAGVAGLVLAQLGTYYIPWNVTVGLPVVAATAASLLAAGPRRQSLIVLGTGALTGAIALGLVFRENAAALAAAFDTVYPGDRRSTGEPLAPFQLFGAPGLVTLRNDVAPVVLNASEIASAFLVCAIWALALSRRLRPSSGPQRAFAWVLGVGVVVLVLWSTVSWGTLGSHVPLLNLVPAIRAAQTVGYPASILLCLVLSRVGPLGLREALPVAAACALVTAWGVGNLKATALPTMGQAAPFLVPLVVGGLVLVVTRWRGWWSVAILGAALAWSASHVNPVTFGLGDFRETHAAATARSIADAAREEGTYVATDSGYVTALLLGNGVPTITGYQTSGPDEETWALVDPRDRFEDQWNRGASFLGMTFDRRSGAYPVIGNPSLDYVMISLDPCALDPRLRVTRFVSAQDLDRPCLEHTATFQWEGLEQHVYEVREPSGRAGRGTKRD